MGTVTLWRTGRNLAWHMPHTLFCTLSPRQESNPHYELRKLASYPLNDEGLFLNYLAILTKPAHIVKFEHKKKYGVQ